MASQIGTLGEGILDAVKNGVYSKVDYAADDSTRVLLDEQGNLIMNVGASTILRAVTDAEN